MDEDYDIALETHPSSYLLTLMEQTFAPATPDIDSIKCVHAVNLKLTEKDGVCIPRFLSITRTMYRHNVYMC